MPDSDQAAVPEKEISVDLAESDASKAVSRKPAVRNIAAEVRDDDMRTRRTPAEQALFKRMSRFQKAFDQKMADAQAEWQRERSDLLKRLEGVKVERPGEAEAASAHEAAMKVLTEKLAAANEKGDSVEAAKITAEMIRADGLYHAKLSGSQARADTQGRTEAAPAARAAPAASGPTAAGSRFILANEDWWDDPDFAVEKAAANTYYLQLINEEGFDKNSDETFREVAKRLKAKFRDLDVRAGRGRVADADDEDGDADEARHEQSTRRAPAARISDRGTTQGARQTSRTLTAKDIKTMRDVGMDPDKDDHVVRFLREVVASEEHGRGA